MTETRATRDQPRQDDGDFGPDNNSRRLFSDRPSRLGGVSAVVMRA